jgi:hypothetical protein
MSIQNSPPPLSVHVQGFFRDEPPKGPVAAPPAPAADPALGLNELRENVSNGSQQDRELALDILVNLAAGSGIEAKKAGETLLGIYAEPRCSDPAGNASVRRHIEKLSHRLCELALDRPTPDSTRAPELFVDKDSLSLTVAYLGGRSQDPPEGVNGGAMRSYIETFIRGKLPDKGEGAPKSNDQFLGAGRTTEAPELTAAMQKLTSFQHSPVVLEVWPDSMGEDLRQSMFVQPLQNLVDQLEDSENHCACALINIGEHGFQHWMPLVLHTNERAEVHCHVMNSEASKCAGRKLDALLERALSRVFKDPNHVHIHKSDMQGTAAGAQACGVLALRLLDAVDRQIQFKEEEVEPASWEKEASVACGMDEFNMESFIEGHMKEWNAMPADDQHAAMVSHRSRLLDAWAGQEPVSSRVGVADLAARPGVSCIQPMPEAPPGEPPPNAGTLPQAQLAPHDAVMPGDGPLAEVQPTPPPGPPPLDDAGLTSVQKYIKAECGKFAKSVNLGPPGSEKLRVGNDFQKLSQRLQECPLSAPRDKRNGAEVAAHAKAMRNPELVMERVLGETPPGLQKFAQATMEQQVLDHRLQNSSLRGLSQFAETSAPTPPDLTQLGFRAVLAQGPTRFHELLEGLVQNADKDAASLKTGKPANAFGAMLKDVPKYVDGRLALLKESIQRLDAIRAAKLPLLGSWAGTFNGRVSVYDPRVKADAEALRAVLQAQVAALEDPDGAPQALVAFAKSAQSDPAWARTVFMASVRPQAG